MRERVWFLVGGIALLGLAAVFLWNDLALKPELLLTVGALVAGGALLWAPKRWAAAALLGGAVMGGGWYAATRADALLPGLALVFAASVASVVLAGDDAWARRLGWAAVTAAGLAASWALYFRFLTVGVAADEVARRLVLTLAWLVAGVVIVVGTRRPRSETQLTARMSPARTSGMTFAGAAFAKALVYDTTHLAGPLRVVVLAAAGALLLVGGALLRGEA
jgi:hypothetical protein